MRAPSKLSIYLFNLMFIVILFMWGQTHIILKKADERKIDNGEKNEVK